MDYTHTASLDITCEYLAVENTRFVTSLKVQPWS